jgi:hypothetical protein
MATKVAEYNMITNKLSAACNFDTLVISAISRQLLPSTFFSIT